MKIKSILSAAAFLIAFAFSAVFAGFFRVETEVQTFFLSETDQPRSARLGKEIKVFLRQDGTYHNELRDALSSDVFDLPFQRLSTPAEAVSVYAGKLNNMEAGAFPQDFQTVWRAHTRAWQNYADFLQQAKNKNFSEGRYHLEKELVSEIDVSWEIVLQIGEKYNPALRSEID